MSRFQKFLKPQQWFISIFSRGLVAATLPFTLVSLLPKPAQAAVLFNPDTGHYYEYLPGSFTWHEAKIAAENRFFNDLQGYLVTITSEAENNFIFQNFILPDYPNPSPNVPGPGWGWIGASDAEQEGTWKWVTGPEAGTIFWLGGSAHAGGTAVDGAFEYWPNTEPNNLGDEDYAHIDYRIINGSWNDWFGFARQGYYVEYGVSNPGEPESVPEPTATLGLLAFGVLGMSSLLKHKRQQQVLGSSLQ